MGKPQYNLQKDSPLAFTETLYIAGINIGKDFEQPE